LPAAIASESGRSTTTPAPSARTKPSADASKALHAPDIDSIPLRESAMLPSGERKRFAPPAIAIFDSPRRRLSQARWAAERDDEQAVSRVRLGPVTPSR
jgi:hypothetical protein